MHAIFVRIDYGKLDAQQVADSSYHPITGQRMTTDEVDAATEPVIDVEANPPPFGTNRGFNPAETPLWSTEMHPNISSQAGILKTNHLLRWTG